MSDKPGNPVVTIARIAAVLAVMSAAAFIILRSHESAQRPVGPRENPGAVTDPAPVPERVEAASTSTTTAPEPTQKPAAETSASSRRAPEPTPVERRRVFLHTSKALAPPPDLDELLPAPAELELKPPEPSARLPKPRAEHPKPSAKQSKKPVMFHSSKFMAPPSE